MAIPQVNLIFKAITMYTKQKRLQRVHELIKDPILGAKTQNDLKWIQKNNEIMLRMNKFAIYGVCATFFLWLLSFILTRLEDHENAVIPSYVPFDTKSTMGYSIGVFCEVSPTLWIGFAHLGWDCIVATYYSQGTTQLKIIKQNIEHIFDNDGINEDNFSIDQNSSMERFQYIDEMDGNIRVQFIYIVERYRKVAWYINEISAIFDKSMSIQFFSTSVTSCLVVYRMSSMSLVSVMFLYMAIILVLFQMQSFLYCFFGHLVEHESLSISDAVYFSDWVSVSPRFRREVLIAMTRWGQPLTPRVSSIVPVTLTTFVSIVNLSYRLYAVMKSTQMT
uniref:Odorant receptor 48 n=1 Tax=Conogethes pinicolalis TaxID=1178461 RepID=A0A5B9GCM4_9NEOP|nr:odorant receptor 48 [Conogethes pinicolalis]